MNNLEEIKDLTQKFVKEIDSRKEPLDLIQSILKTLKSSLENPDFLKSEAKYQSYIRETMVPEICQTIARQPVFLNQEFCTFLKDLLHALTMHLLRELHMSSKNLSPLRFLLEPESAIYRKTFEEFTSPHYKYCPPVPLDWLKALQKGQKIDALKEERTKWNIIEGWSPGTIESISEGSLTVLFDGMDVPLRRTFDKDSGKIAPLGYRTGGSDWREAIQIGDFLDVYDTQGCWIISTVLDIKTENVKEIYVGYRVYMEEGTKTDSKGRHFEGWSESFDEYIPAFSLRIQRPGTITKKGIEYCRKITYDESLVPDDSTDILINYPVKGDTVYVVYRINHMYSGVYIELMKAFGNSGGFAYIVERTKSSELLDPDLLCNYIELLSAPYNVYHRVLVQYFIAPFVEACLIRLSSYPDDLLRNVKKEKLDNALSLLERLMRRVYTVRTKNEELIKLRISMGLSLLRSPVLDRRIQAIKLIGETCRSAKQSQHSLVQGPATTSESRVVSKMLLVPRIIEEIFGKWSHVQLIQRSSDILKFFLLNDTLSEKELDVIWECCIKDDQSKVEIYKVIVDSLYYLSKELVAFWINKFATLEPSLLKDVDMELICEFEQKFAYLTPGSLKQALDLIWNVAANNKGAYVGVLAEMREKLLNRFTEFITAPYHVPESTMNEYLTKAYQILEEGQNVTFALKILRKVFKQLPNISRFKTRLEAQNFYFQNGELIAKVYKHLKEKHDAAKSGKIKVNEKDYKEEQSEIKEFFNFAFTDANYRVKRDDLEILWVVWVKDPIVPSLSGLFYSFLKELVSFGLKDCMGSLEDATKFFTETLCNERNNFTNISAESFEAISNFMVGINKFAGNLTVIDKYQFPRIYPTLVGPEPPKEENEFKVRVDPKEILGLSALWKIALESKNDIVAVLAIELLNKLHTKLEDSLEDKIGEISTGFIETAIEKLGAFYKAMVLNNENRSKEIIMIIKLIEDMIDESERKGNNGFTPLYALHKFRKITVKLSDNTITHFSKIGRADEPELTISSSITCWQLKMLISSKLHVPPELQAVVVNNIALKDKDNGKTLEELGVTDGSTMTVSRKQSENLKYEPLLNSEQKLTEKAEKAFTEIFSRFSTEGKMSPAQCVNFTKIAVCDYNVTENDSRIRNFFSKCGAATTGYVTLEQFLKFYESSAKDRQKTVWMNLNEFGYRADLLRGEDLYSLFSNSAPSHKFPRWLLSNTSTHFSLLLDLFRLGGEVADATWKLILKLCPNQSFLSEVLNLFGAETFDWNAIFPHTDLCQTMYKLYIASAILMDVTEEDLLLFPNDPFIGETRKNWKVEFLSKGGIGFLLSIFNCVPKAITNDKAARTLVTLAFHMLAWYLFTALKANHLIPPAVKQIVTVVEESKEPVGNEYEAQLEVAVQRSLQKYVKKEYYGPYAEDTLIFFKELKTALKGDLGVKLLKSIDMVSMALLAFNVLGMLVKVKEVTCEFQEIAEVVGHILRSILLYAPGTYNTLLERAGSNIRETLIRGALSVHNGWFREFFEKIIYFLNENVHDGKMPLQKNPLGDLLKGMLDMRIFTEEKECEELLEVLLSALETYKIRADGEKSFDVEIKLKEALEYLKNYESKESVDSVEPDKGLVGLLKIAEKLLTMDISKGTTISTPKELVDSIFYQCLFPLREASSTLHRYKCKTSQSRSAAFKLIESFFAFDVDSVVYLLRNCIPYLPPEVYEPITWDYSPDKYKRSSSGFVGIRNLGCVCYMISMVQQFFLIPPFRNGLLSVSDNEPPNVAGNPMGIDDNFLHQLQMLFGFLQWSTRIDYNPYKLCYSFKDYDNRPTNTAVQQDAHEFLNILLDRLEQKLHPTHYKKLLQSIFGGKICNQLICKKCGTIKSNYEDMYTLSLEVKNQRNFQEAMEKFIAISPVSGYFCEACQEKVDVDKRTLLASLPNVLIVHLQRFTYNFDLGINEKIHSRFEFPNALNLCPYTEYAKEKCGSKGSPRADPGYEYKLVGVVVHNGNAESGHYYSFINVNREQSMEVSNEYMSTEKDRWVEFNDSMVREFDFKRLPAECFGGACEEPAVSVMQDVDVGGRSKSAYMLLYERRLKTPILLKYNTPLKETEDIVLEEIHINNEAVAKLVQEATKEGRKCYYRDKDELYELHDYHTMPQNFPEDIKKEVDSDNTCFLYERLIFNKEFCSHLCELIKRAHAIYVDVASSPETKEALRSSLAIITRNLILSVLIHGNLADITDLLELSDVLIQIVYSTDALQSLHLLDMFTGKPAKLYNMLIKCPDLPIRRFVTKILVAGVTTALRAESEFFDVTELVPVTDKPPMPSPIAQSRKLLDILVDFIGNDLATYWTKFGQFFETLRDIYKNNQAIVGKYYSEKDLIALLLDFYLEKQSPFYMVSEKRYEMGSMAANPDFEPLIELVYALVCSPHEISSKAWKCLCTPELIQKYVRQGGKISKLKDMLVRLMTDNKKYSKSICTLLLTVISEFEVHKVLQYFPLICDTICISDKYQQYRLEWVLGVPQPEIRSHLAPSYGLAAVNDISNDVIGYVSPLKASPKDSPFLQQLWSQRNKYEFLTLQCLKRLLEVVVSNEGVYEYFRKVQPPTYQFSKYTDWIEGFLDAYGELVSRFIDSDSKKEKEGIIADVKGLLKAYEGKVAMSEDIPKYMIGFSQQEKEIMCKKYTDQNVKVHMFEIVTEVYPGLSIDPQFLVKYFGHSKAIVPKKPETTEKTMPVNKSYVEFKPIQPGYTAGANQKLIYDLDEGFMDVPEYPSHSPHQWQTETEMRDIEGEGRDLTNEEIALIFGGNNEKEADKEKKGIAEPIIINKEPIEEDMQYEEKKTEYSSTLLKIEIVNSGDYSGNVKVLVSPQGAGKNCYIPKSSIKLYIGPNSNTLAWYLMKYDVEKDWGEILADLKFSKQSMARQDKPQATQLVEPVISSEDDGKIPCPTCTLLNSPWAKVCSLCNSSMNPVAMGESGRREL